MFILLAGVSLGEVVRPTVAGVLKSAQGNRVVIVNETGTTWTAEAQPNFQCQWRGKQASLASIPKGSRVMLRVVGSMTDRPLKVDLLADWESSSRYVATQAASPYYTRMGEWAGPGGVGGRPPNAPEVGKPKNPGAYAINGGFPHQNPESIPNILGPAQQNPGSGQLPRGTPGFEAGPGPAQPLPSPATPPNPVLPPPPGMAPVPQTYDPYNAPQPGVMNPYMSPYQAQSQAHSPQSMDSLLNGDDPERQDNSMMFPSPVAVGPPVQLQGIVVRFDPASRSLMIQSPGSQFPQQVIVSPQAVMPSLREGQQVTITGTSTPQGFIEAQQVVPLGY